MIITAAGFYGKALGEMPVFHLHTGFVAVFCLFCFYQYTNAVGYVDVIEAVPQFNRTRTPTRTHFLYFEAKMQQKVRFSL